VHAAGAGPTRVSSVRLLISSAQWSVGVDFDWRNLASKMATPCERPINFVLRCITTAPSTCEMFLLRSLQRCEHSLTRWFRCDRTNISDPIRSDLIRSDPIRSDFIRSDPILSDPILSDPILSDPIRSDPIRSDPIRSDPIGQSPMVRAASSRPSSCARVARASRGASTLYSGEACRYRVQVVLMIVQDLLGTTTWYSNALM
jgi:hypothetical protein